MFTVIVRLKTFVPIIIFNFIIMYQKTVTCLIVYCLTKLELIFIIFDTLHPNSPCF